MTNPAHLSGLGHLDSFIMTPNARPPIGTLQKRMPTLTLTATQLNRRAVICKVLDTRQLDGHDIPPTYNSIRVRNSIYIPRLPTHKQEFVRRHRDTNTVAKQITLLNTLTLTTRQPIVSIKHQDC
jgi:hypothetical protein